MFESAEIYPPRAIAPFCHGSTVVPLPSGEILVAWYSGDHEKAADVAIYMSRLGEKSREWSNPEIIEQEGISALSGEPSSEGNPVLYFDEDNNRLWMWWVTMIQADTGWSMCVIKCKDSSDFGKSWSEPRLLRDMVGWMTRHKPIKMSNGEIILPIYAEWAGYSSLFYLCTPNEFARGATESEWIEPSHFITGNVLQPTLVEPNPRERPGQLLCYLRTATGSKHYPYMTMVQSSDYGRTWTEIEKMPAKFHNPNAGSDMVRLPSGDLVLAFNPDKEGRSTLRVALSEDEGQTWIFWKDLEHKPGSSFAYPAIAAGKDGTLHLTWSHDGGATVKWAHFDKDFLVT